MSGQVDFGFNPCFNGLWGQTQDYAFRITQQDQVSILVLMDCGDRQVIQ